MRRIIVILLLALLPVQFGWAAAAVYCNHETGAAAKHFGHHEHAHQGQGAAGDQDAKKLSTVDADCGICHFASVSNVSDALQGFAEPPPAAEYTYSIAYLSHVPSGPERPDRRLAS